MSKTCKVDGCESKCLAKGYCNRHYKQYKKYGTITYTGRSRLDTNEIIERDDYAEIVLYDKQNNEIARAIVDLEYVDTVKQYKWCLNRNGYPFNNQVGFLHRFLMNPSDDMVVDHINHNRLDNRISNLRICTQQENCMNSGQRYGTSSGVTGVSWYAQRNKWEAYINISGKRVKLGYFKTKEEAIEARRQAEIEYYGEFAPNRE